MQSTVRSAFRWLGCISASALLFSSLQVEGETPGADPLIEGFRDPPPSARPRVWWHWMDGNVSKDGIAKDLAWMKRVGIGGVQSFDASLGTPKVVDQPLRYMSAEWKDAFRFAVAEAERQGLEFGIASSPGFSETGGPWVKPEDGMKKLVWSETVVEGGTAVTASLPLPPDQIGPFQDLRSTALGKMATPLLPFYRDVAVLALPLGRDLDIQAPRFSTADGDVDHPGILGDGRYKETVRVSTGTRSAPGSLTASFSEPVSIRSVTMFLPGKTSLMDVALAPRLEASIDGETWTAVAEIPVSSVPTTVSFPRVRARQFRLVLAPRQVSGLNQNAPAPGAVGAEILGGLGTSVPKAAGVAEFRLSSEPRINRFETKAGFAVSDDYYALEKPQLEGELGTPTSRVIDLT